VVFRLHNRTKSRWCCARSEGRSRRRHPDPHDVEISTRHVIAHLAQAAARHADKVEKGRGYVPHLRRYGDEPTKSIGASCSTLRSPVRAQLCGRECACRTAHRPRQAGDGDRNQRAIPPKNDPPVGEDPGRTVRCSRSSKALSDLIERNSTPANFDPILLPVDELELTVRSATAEGETSTTWRLIQRTETSS